MKRNILLVLLVLVLGTGCTSLRTNGEPKADPWLDLTENTEQAEQEEPEVLTPEVAEGEQDMVEAHDLPVADDATPLTPQEEQALQTQPEIHFALDDQERKEVQLHFKYFTHRNRKTFQRWLKRSEAYLPYVKRVFKERGLPEELSYLPFVESGYNPRAYSRAGAGGMWQFMPFTGRKYGLKKNWWIDERRDPYKATVAAADYLETLYNMFGDWYLALAAYNAGEGKIGRALKATNCDDFFELTKKNHTLRRRARLRAETRNYVPKFLAVLKIIRNLESLGFEPLNMDNEPQLTPMDVKGGTDLLALSKSIGVSWKAFHENNRAFRRYVSPPESDSTIYVPATKSLAVREFLQKPGATPYAGYSTYRIRRGDSWYRISRRYGVPIRVLKKVNKRRSNLLRPGQRIVIPRSGSSMAVASASQRTRKYAAQRGNYRVRRGDTLSEISHRFGVSVSTLKRANGLRSARSLRAGQKLYIPDHNPKQAERSQARAAQVKRAVVKSADATTYKVRRGDTLTAISRSFGVSINDIKRANNIHSARSLRAGQKLYIPGNSPAPSGKAQVYRVRRGDSVWTIAKKFGVSHKDILRWNNLSSRSVIRPGDKLNIYQ